MSDLASAFKKEMARLARKEVRAGTAVTRKAAAQHRRDIADLKRQVAALTRHVTYLERQDRRRAQEVVPAARTEGRRFSAKGLRTHRDKLGVSAADYGALVGVTGQTVYNWEQGKSRPRDEQLAGLIEVRSLGKRDAIKRLEEIES